MKKLWTISRKRKLTGRMRRALRLPAFSDDAKMRAMKPIVLRLSVLLFAALFSAGVSAQTFASGAAASPDAQLEALTKKIDEQNTKIDALSQQILKLEQQITNLRPGVMIGETTPTAAPAATPAPAPATGNSHVVTKGETLTSIAKANKVGVQELQKFNRIENDRALQIGQTIMIPTPGSAGPTATPSSSPNE